MLIHLSNLVEHTRKGGWRGARWWFLKQYHRNKPGEIEGTNVFEFDWDILIIVDGCDPDWMRAVAPEYDFLDDDTIDEITSVGTASFDWHENTFGELSPELLEKTALISANPYVSDRTPDSLGFIDDVGDWGWNDELGTVPAHRVTDAAIEVGRETNYQRYIVHYMQPHVPFLNGTKSDNRYTVELAYDETHCFDVWYDTMTGKMDSDELRNYYVENLKYVLDEVNYLRQNFDADKAFLSSDHGNAVGQGGMYGHPGRAKIEWIRQVPWISIDIQDRQTITPDINRDRKTPSRKKQLEALGYI